MRRSSAAPMVMSWGIHQLLAEGECGSACGAVNRDLITACDGEDDIVSGAAQDSAVNDGGAGIFCPVLSLLCSRKSLSLRLL